MRFSLTGYDIDDVPAEWKCSAGRLADWLLINYRGHYTIYDHVGALYISVRASSLWLQPRLGLMPDEQVTADLIGSIKAIGFKQKEYIQIKDGLICSGRKILAALLGMDADLWVAVKFVRPEPATSSEATGLEPDSKATGLVKEECWDCVLKHLGQAFVLAEEALMGYPWYQVVAWGHMAEASLECPDSSLGHRIRDERLLWQSMGQVPDFKELIESAQRGKDEG